MREFERIRVEKGQAYIRDTGITVSEVVKEIVKSTPNTAITKHTDLDLQDIIAALMFAVHDITKAIWIHQNEGINPLTSVRINAAILSDPEEILPNGERIDIGESILKNTLTSIRAWSELTEWISQTYGIR